MSERTCRFESCTLRLENSNKVTPLFYQTYLAVINNSQGASLWRNFYAKVNGRETDITQNGNLSCAFFVSTLLVTFSLIKRIHATVKGTIKDLKKSGWRMIKNPRKGSILIWEAKKEDDGKSYEHIGFYMGDKTAISNSSRVGKPVLHHWTFGVKNGAPVRKIKAIFWRKSW